MSMVGFFGFFRKWCGLLKYLQSVCCLQKKQFPSAGRAIVLKLDPIRFVLCTPAATNCEKVLRYFLCVCVCVPLCKRVKRKPIFVDIWPLLIIPQATNKPQTHILSCLSCGASLLQSVMSNQCYRLLKGQVGGCFLRVDTWFSGPAITEPTITSLTCPPLIGLEQQSFMRLPLEVRGGQCGTKQQARHQSERRHCASANLKL